VITIANANIFAQAASAAVIEAGGSVTANTVLGIAAGIVTVAAGVISVLWKLDRAQLVERIKEANLEAEKLSTRYDQATERYQTAVSELAGARSELAREQGRREGQAPKLMLPPPAPPSSNKL
jgi:hypothetical protein